MIQGVAKTRYTVSLRVRLLATTGDGEAEVVASCFAATSGPLAVDWVPSSFYQRILAEPSLVQGIPANEGRSRRRDDSMLFKVFAIFSLLMTWPVL